MTGGWEYLPNGDFETGDFTNWDVGVYGTATATIVNDGDHGNVVQFYTDGGGSNLIYIAQYDIDTSNATGIKIDYNVILNGEYHYEGNVSYGSLVLIIEPGYLQGGQIIYLDTSATIDWTSKEYTLEVPDENSKIAIQFYNNFSEPFSVCIDNIVINDTYLITYTPTAWDTATATVFTFSSECGKNATTLGTINYGDGGLTLEFVENIGTDTGLTWTIDTDVFRADINQDYSRIASIVRGKGTKLCTGTVYSYLADNTYALTVSTIGDTFLRTAATAGADKIYVYDNTHFGTAYGYGGNFQLVVGHNDTREILDISATGENGECTIQPNKVTEYAHPILEDVMNLGCFYATGSADEVNNFMLGLADTFTKYGGNNLSVFIGSEMVYLNCHTGTPYVKLNDNTVKLFMKTNGRDDSYGYAYPHAPGSPVISALYFTGGLQNPNSMYARYGSREAYVNPVGIFDGDTMDKLCYHSLMSGTPNGTWGRVMMPASLLPATVGIGDWVNIAEADLSATTCYQIVGLEYDQKKGVFWIELGSTEDYYLESIAGNRGTFDLSLSNY